MKRRTAALAFLAGILSVACANLPQNTSPTDTHTLYAWPLDRCPSVPPAVSVERAVPLLGALGGILAGDLISGLVGIPAAALADAADADRKGFTASGTNARFYYRVSRNAQGVAEPVLPGCYVVAYAKPNGGTAWCDDTAFAAGAGASCQNGKALIASLYAKERLKGQSEPLSSIPSVPEFYAEIGFDRAGYETIVRPRVTAIYYPKSLLDASSSNKRTLSISLTLTSPVAGDALKAASVAITLPGVTPGARIPQEDLTNAQTAWSSIPVIKPSVAMDEEGAYLPITIVGTLHEVGDPSLFLAAFAKSFGASTGDISKAIGSAVLPAGQAATQQQAQTNVASYNSAYASALKSNADYLAACAKKPASDTDKQAAEALYYGVIANRQKANIAASTASLPPAFSSTDPEAGRCF